MAADKPIFDEAGLDPKEWEVVDAPPIIPAADLETALEYPAHRLPTGMLSVRAQAEQPQAGIPVRALWPVQAPGKANSNAAIVSGTKKIAKEAQVGVTVSNTPVVGVDSGGNTTLAPIGKLPVPPKLRMPVTQDNVNDGSRFLRLDGVLPGPTHRMTLKSMIGDTSGDTTTNLIDGGNLRFLHPVMSGPVQNVVNSSSEIVSTAPISGRTEGVGTTVQKLNSSGLLLDVDQIAAQGATHKVVSAIDSNERALIDFTQAGHISKDLDNIGDGSNFGRVVNTALTSNQPDLSKGGILGKTLVNIADDAGSSRFAVANIDANRRALIDFTQAGHLSKNLDNIGDTSNYVRGAQNAGSAIVLDNANFTAGTAGWSALDANATISQISSSPFTNGKALQVSTASLFDGAQHNRFFKANAGDQFFMSCWINSDGTFQCKIQISYFDGAGTFLGSDGASSLSTSWTQISFTGTAPTNTATIQVVFVRVDATGGTHICRFANPHVVRIASLDNEVADGSSRFARTSVHSSHAPTTNPLTAHDVGSNVTINIAAHTMQVGGTAVSNNSGSVTALSYSTLYYVYYDDPTLAGGAVSYQATTTKTTAINGEGRFFVGSVLTPKATAPDTVGNGDGGTGSQVGTMYQILFNTATPTVSGGTVTNPSNAIDGDFTTFAALAPPATGGGSATLVVSGIPGIRTGRAQTITLKVLSSVAISGPLTAILSYSLNGGASFTVIYSVTANRATQVDSITLLSSQNPGLVQVKAQFVATGTSSGALDLFEAWIEIQE